MEKKKGKKSIVEAPGGLIVYILSPGAPPGW